MSEIKGKPTGASEATQEKRSVVVPARKEF